MEKHIKCVEELRDIVVTKRNELKELEKQLHDLEATPPFSDVFPNSLPTPMPASLNNNDILRYSRQLILPQIGVEGQLNLKKAKVLVVGCGGLGCPVAVYLAASGVGLIGLLDYDKVEISNLHRQVAHSVETLEEDKCSSLALACRRLNPSIRTQQHKVMITSHNALDIIKQYDIVVDASDNVPTRYLLSDACVLLNRKPLVSGSALKLDGQLTTYNHGDSPCYRCIHPSPPPPNTVNNCSDGGVIGPVVGTIGCLQALEVVKIITNMNPSYAGKLLVYDGLEGAFKTYRLRGRQGGCAVCGTTPSILQLMDYPLFCNSAPTDKDTPLSLLQSHDRISAKAYKDMLDAGKDHILVDVREPTELQICKLPHHTINIRMKDILKKITLETIKQHLTPQRHTIVVVCRRGNNSQKAVKSLKTLLKDDYVVDGGYESSDGGSVCDVGSVRDGASVCDGGKHGEGDIGEMNKKDKVELVDIVGGFYAWKDQVDEGMPVY